MVKKEQTLALASILLILMSTVSFALECSVATIQEGKLEELLVNVVAHSEVFDKQAELDSLAKQVASFKSQVTNQQWEEARSTFRRVSGRYQLTDNLAAYETYSDRYAERYIEGQALPRKTYRAGQTVRIYRRSLGVNEDWYIEESGAVGRTVLLRHVGEGGQLGTVLNALSYEELSKRIKEAQQLEPQLTPTQEIPVRQAPVTQVIPKMSTEQIAQENQKGQQAYATGDYTTSRDVFFATYEATKDPLAGYMYGRSLRKLAERAPEGQQYDLYYEAFKVFDELEYLGTASQSLLRDIGDYKADTEEQVRIYGQIEGKHELPRRTRRTVDAVVESLLEGRDFQAQEVVLLSRIEQVLEDQKMVDNRKLVLLEQLPPDHDLSAVQRTIFQADQDVKETAALLRDALMLNAFSDHAAQTVSASDYAILETEAQKIKEQLRNAIAEGSLTEEAMAVAERDVTVQNELDTIKSILSAPQTLLLADKVGQIIPVYSQSRGTITDYYLDYASTEFGVATLYPVLNGEPQLNAPAISMKLDVLTDRHEQAMDLQTLEELDVEDALEEFEQEEPIRIFEHTLAETYEFIYDYLVARQSRDTLRMLGFSRSYLSEAFAYFQENPEELEKLQTHVTQRAAREGTDIAIDQSLINEFAARQEQEDTEASTATRILTKSDTYRFARSPETIQPGQKYTIASFSQGRNSVWTIVNVQDEEIQIRNEATGQEGTITVDEFQKRVRAAEYNEVLQALLDERGEPAQDFLSQEKQRGKLFKIAYGMYNGQTYQEKQKKNIDLVKKSVEELNSIFPRQAYIGFSAFPQITMGLPKGHSVGSFYLNGKDVASREQIMSLFVDWLKNNYESGENLAIKMANWPTDRNDNVVIYIYSDAQYNRILEFLKTVPQELLAPGQTLFTKNVAERAAYANRRGLSELGQSFGGYFASRLSSFVAEYEGPREQALQTFWDNLATEGIDPEKPYLVFEKEDITEQEIEDFEFEPIRPEATQRPPFPKPEIRGLYVNPYWPALKWAGRVLKWTFYDLPAHALRRGQAPAEETEEASEETPEKQSPGEISGATSLDVARTAFIDALHATDETNIIEQLQREQHGAQEVDEDFCNS